MADKTPKTSIIPRCPECSTIVQPEYRYCPMCKANLKDEISEKTMEAVELIVSDTEPLTSTQLTSIYKTFHEKDMAKNHPEWAHLLEEKVCHKFIRNVAELSYTINDMVKIAKKILMLARLQYSKQY
jgi:hypothetical protein